MLKNLFKIIESTQQVFPKYENYNLISTFSEFKEMNYKTQNDTREFYYKRRGTCT